MSAYHCEIKKVSRGTGRSAVAAAAYRASAAMTDDRTSKRHDYRRKAGTVSSDITLPAGAPAELHDRSTLWNGAEAAEHRQKSVTAREAVLALPHQLTDEQRHDLTHQMSRWLADQYRVGVDTAIHRPNRAGDQRNHHAHLLFTTRELTSNGFGAKTRVLDAKQTGSREITRIRRQWATLCNQALAAADHPEIEWTHKSHTKTDNPRMPTRHLGAAQSALERKGVQTATGDVNRQARAINSKIDVTELVERRDEAKVEYDQARDQLAQIKRQQTEAYQQAGLVSRSAISVGLKPMPMQQQKQKAEKKAKRAGTALQRISQRLDRVRNRSRDLMLQWRHSMRGRAWSDAADRQRRDEQIRDMEARDAEKEKQRLQSAPQHAQAPGAPRSRSRMRM